MSLVINGLSDQPKHFAEVNKLLVVTSGYDKPHYVDLAGGRAGELGFQDWSNYWQKVTGVADNAPVDRITEDSVDRITEDGATRITEEVLATGTLETGKFYSAVVAPVNERRSSNVGFVLGQPTAPSVPVEITEAGSTSSITWTIPVHPQKSIVALGSTTGVDGSASCIDADQSFIVNELAGKTIKNLTDKSEATIISNTANQIVGTLSGGTDNDWDLGDEYQVIDDEATARRIYVSAGDTAATAWAGPFRLQATIEDNTTTTYIQTSQVNTSVTADFDRLPPPNARFCLEAFRRVWFTGSVRELRGKAEYQASLETKTADTFNITVVTSDFGTTDGQYLRWTLASGTWTDVVRGSVINATSAGATPIDSSNELTDVIVTRVEDVASPTWFEVFNDNGLAESSKTATVTMKPNYFIGNTSGDDQTFFLPGLVGASFALNAENSPATVVDEVDSDLQHIRILTDYKTNLTGDQEFTCESSIELFWSITGDAGVVPIGNVIEVPGRPFALGSLDRHILIFTERQILKIAENNIQQGFYTVASDRGTTAPYSLVRETRGYTFFDGEGLSRTDGVGAQSISRYKADDYLRDVNQEQTYNIRGVYDPQRDQLFYTFPLGTSPVNDFGLIINAATSDFYPIKLLDANALWRERSADGQWNIFHGSTNRNTQSGKSYIWEHDFDFESDGTTPTEGWIGNVTAVDTSSEFITVADITSNPIVPGSNLNFEPYQYEGVPAIIVDAIASQELHFIVKKIDDNGDGTHDVYWGQDYPLDTTDVSRGLAFFLGVIPCHFGPKFTDFGSPRFLHSVKEVSLDFENLTGPSWIFVDYYRNGITSVVKTTAHYITTGRTKVVSPCRIGKSYQFGYRVRVYSPNRVKLHNITITFTTHT